MAGYLFRTKSNKNKWTTKDSICISCTDSGDVEVEINRAITITRAPRRFFPRSPPFQKRDHEAIPEKSDDARHPPPRVQIAVVRDRQRWPMARLSQKENAHGGRKKRKTGAAARPCKCEARMDRRTRDAPDVSLLAQHGHDEILPRTTAPERLVVGSWSMEEDGCLVVDSFVPFH
jgi:hypothetical protein